MINKKLNNKEVKEFSNISNCKLNYQIFTRKELTLKRRTFNNNPSFILMTKLSAFRMSIMVYSSAALPTGGRGLTLFALII